MRTTVRVIACVAVVLAGCADGKDGHMSGSPSGSSSGNPHGRHTMAGMPMNDPKAHTDHDARHGGVLTMEGDYHVEIVVAADGSIDLFVSDAVRGLIPPGDVKGSITIEAGQGTQGKTVLTLAPGATKGALSVKGPPPDGSTTYTWELDASGQKLKMSLAVPKGGTASIASPASGAMEH
jgi:hypothetical protein